MPKNKREFYMDNNLMKQILNLEKKSFKGLKEMYEKLYCECASTNSKSQLIRKIAYRLQELKYGFLSEKHDQKLERMTDEFEKGKCFAAKKFFKPTHGTRIKRT
jgi:tRNA A37 threonylcarbamoyltransferase TsaD